MHTLQFLKKHTEAIAWLLIGTGIAIVAIFCGLVYANNLGWGQGVFDIERTGQAGSFVVHRGIPGKAALIFRKKYSSSRNP